MTIKRTLNAERSQLMVLIKGKRHLCTSQEENIGRRASFRVKKKESPAHIERTYKEGSSNGATKTALMTVFIGGAHHSKLSQHTILNTRGQLQFVNRKLSDKQPWSHFSVSMKSV